MALNTFKCNYLTPLHFKGLTLLWRDTYFTQSILAIILATDHLTHMSKQAVLCVTVNHTLDKTEWHTHGLSTSSKSISSVGVAVSGSVQPCNVSLSYTDKHSTEHMKHILQVGKTFIYTCKLLITQPDFI